MKLRRKRTKKLTRKSNCISHADLPQFIGHRNMNVGDNPDNTPSLSEMYYFACSLHSLLLTNCIFMSHTCVELLQLLFLFFSLSVSPSLPPLCFILSFFYPFFLSYANPLFFTFPILLPPSTSFLPLSSLCFLFKLFYFSYFSASLFSLFLSLPSLSLFLNVATMTNKISFMLRTFIFVALLLNETSTSIVTLTQLIRLITARNNDSFVTSKSLVCQTCSLRILVSTCNFGFFRNF